MLVYTLKRTFIALLILIVVSALTFSLSYVSTDPAMTIAGGTASAADIEAIRVLYGFDQPVYQQYLNWAGRALVGDFGESYHYKMQVSEMIGMRIGTTVTLGVCSILFALIVSITLGTLAAMHPNSALDRSALFFAVVGQALPTFWFALMMMIVLGVWWRVLPISGNSTWQHFVMPTIALGYYATPALMRLTRAGMIEVLASDYIRTARAKGLRPMTVLFKHALRNAIIPVVSLAAVWFGFMLGGSIVIETIFNLKGIGWLSYDALLRADLPVVQAIVLIFAAFYVVLTFLSDLLNAYLDPRISVR